MPVPPDHRTDNEPARAAGDWRTVSALNVASALAQIGQFGIVYVVLPAWLAARGLDAWQLGLFAASLWLGQLPGLALAPWLCLRFGARSVIVAGLLCTVVALPWIALSGWPAWLFAGTLAGFGLGLRWIGLEPWLYHAAPAEARGRMVGFHESLIALAPVIAPGLASHYGLQGNAVFWIGGVFTAGALLPLAFARVGGPPVARVDAAVPALKKVPWHDPVFRQGVVIALLGGLMEAALSGLFALYAQGRGVAVTQVAGLLTVFGLGGLLLQYGAGWLADRVGVRAAALACAIGTALVAVSLVLPLGQAMQFAAVFMLGGFITAFLTLALVAATGATQGTLARNVSMIAMLYTASAIVGPLLAGPLMTATHTDALMAFTAAASLAMAGLLAIPFWRLRSTAAPRPAPRE